MDLKIDELLAYTDEERAKWEGWFAEHGNEQLKLAVPMDVHPNIGTLILHCFWAELFYANWMRGDMLTQEQMKKIIEGLDAEHADQVFAFGRSSRAAMRDALSGYTEQDWEKRLEVEGPGFKLDGSSRKLIAHILVHEIRHWAQVAVMIRQHNLAPPGEHDLLFSTSFGPLLRKLQ
jgi:uncharacterized damage-inducible protein DinB